MYFITLFQQQFGEIGSILTGNACNEGSFGSSHLYIPSGFFGDVRGLDEHRNIVAGGAGRFGTVQDKMFASL